MSTHPSSIISSKAKIGKDVVIGPFCIINDDVTIGDNCEIKSHVVIDGPTVIGEGNVIWPFNILGGDCQNIKSDPKAGKLIIGNDNVIREGCKIHRGSEMYTQTTEIGNNNFIMGNVHVAHDAVIGDHNIVTNNSSLGGHVEIGNRVIIGGHTAIHQFCRIGDYAFMGRGALVVQDIPPYVKVASNNIKACGINTLALNRDDWSEKKILAIKQIYKIFYRQCSSTTEALNNPEVQSLCDDFTEVAYFVEFIKSSERGITR